MRWLWGLGLLHGGSLLSPGFLLGFASFQGVIILLPELIQIELFWNCGDGAILLLGDHLLLAGAGFKWLDVDLLAQEFGAAGG